MIRRMVVGRGDRGRRAQGHRWSRSLRVLMLIASTGAILCVAPALGAGRRADRARHTHVGAHGARTRGNPLTRRAMWIWELGNSSGGSLPAIITLAHQYGVGTVMLKSSDGTSFWSSQFTAQVVRALHAGGLRVCAWQYVYGNYPVVEAYQGAGAVRNGADCLLIDAESEYEGKYISAQTYVRALRALVGYRYPLALAGFPYIDYHPAFPYSVFLGPGGAQYNVPQMYWKDIGTSVDSVFAHSYEYNRIYERPIFPLGQLYGSPPLRQVIRFRQISRAYGAGGVSWWDWQEASTGAFSAIARPAGPLAGYAAYSGMASIGAGAQGDLVVWAQEHLISAGFPVAVSGDFGARTLAAVEGFQAAHGLTVDGIIGTDTWAALLRYRTARVIWSARHDARVTSAFRAEVTSASGVSAQPVPSSATLPARRNEIARAGGAGGVPVGARSAGARGGRP